MIIVITILFLIAMLVFSIWIFFLGINSKDYFFMLFCIGIPFFIWLLTFYIKGLNRIKFIDDGVIINNFYFKKKIIFYNEIINWKENISYRLTYNSILIRTKSDKTIVFCAIEEKRYEELRFQLKKRLKDKEIL